MWYNYNAVWDPVKERAFFQKAIPPGRTRNRPVAGSQLELLKVLKEMGNAGHAQFIIASHAPILLACPRATIYNFDDTPIRKIAYKKTEHYRVYREFMADPDKFL